MWRLKTAGFVRSGKFCAVGATPGAVCSRFDREYSMKTHNSRRVMLFAFAALFVTPLATANAATYNNNFKINGQPYSVARVEKQLGRQRTIDLQGKYTLAKGETLDRVDLYWVYPGAGGQVRGIVDPKKMTWRAAVSDYQLNSYYLRFTVKRAGKSYSYLSPTFTFGR